MISCYHVLYALTYERQVTKLITRTIEMQKKLSGPLPTNLINESSMKL